MIDNMPECPPPYETVEIDPETQISYFYDTNGVAIDMSSEGSERVYVTITVSRPGDGSKDAAQVADDSENDRTLD